MTVLALLIALAVPAFVLVAAEPVRGQPATGQQQQQCPPGASASVPPSSESSSLGARPREKALVACVGSQVITVQAFERWAVVDERSESGSKQHLKRAEVIEQVMGFLIQSDWVFAEADALDIHVSAGEVRRTFDHLRRQQFPKHREFRRFLMRSGETVADLMLRVKVNLLSARIQKHVLAGHNSTGSRMRALEAFVKGFKERLQPQTYCAPAYDTPDCGHVYEGF